MKTFIITYEPMMADGYKFGVFHRAGYTETCRIDALDEKDAVRKFREGNYASDICYAEQSHD